MHSWSLALAKKSCNNINNSRAQVSRLCYFLWLWYNYWILTDAASKRVIQKPTEVANDLVGNKIRLKITRILSTIPENLKNLKKSLQYFRKTYILPEKRHKLLMILDYMNFIHKMKYQKIMNLIDDIRQNFPDFTLKKG